MKTKKLILGLGLGVSLLGNFAAHAQSGLTGIVVEKYYRANSADFSADATLPVGTETYRVYADLAPGYQLQAVYGDATHTLTLNTTTTFWNHPTGDQSQGNAMPSASLVNGTLALDSWISMGG